MGDRADAEHREGGREILRNRREEGEERRDLVVVVIEAEEREFSEFNDRRLERAPKLFVKDRRRTSLSIAFHEADILVRLVRSDAKVRGSRTRESSVRSLTTSATTVIDSPILTEHSLRW